MKRDDFRRLLLRVELGLRAVNPLSLLTVGVWLVSAVLLLWLVPAGREELRSLRSEMLQKQSPQWRQLSQAPDSSDALAQRNLDAFNSSLGDARHVEQQLHTLFVIAKDLKMTLPQGQYKLNCEPGAAVCRYKIHFPLKGSYLQIRLFGEQALQAIPFASMDELSFRRESVSDGEVESHLTITLYLQARPEDRMAAGDSGLGTS
jgi:hypothetical protein